jgi:hypothetical protein
MRKVFILGIAIALAIPMRAAAKTEYVKVTTTRPPCCGAGRAYQDQNGNVMLFSNVAGAEYSIFALKGQEITKRANNCGVIVLKESTRLYFTSKNFKIARGTESIPITIDGNKGGNLVPIGGFVPICNTDGTLKSGNPLIKIDPYVGYKDPFYGYVAIADLKFTRTVADGWILIGGLNPNESIKISNESYVRTKYTAKSNKDGLAIFKARRFANGLMSRGAQVTAPIETIDSLPVYQYP